MLIHDIKQQNGRGLVVYFTAMGHGTIDFRDADDISEVNDWDTFWVVLDHPELPLTNNAAERALRHWVIARRISHGTRTAQGTHAY